MISTFPFLSRPLHLISKDKVRQILEKVLPNRDKSFDEIYEDWKAKYGDLPLGSILVQEKIISLEELKKSLPQGGIFYLTETDPEDKYLVFAKEMEQGFLNKLEEEGWDQNSLGLSQKDVEFLQQKQKEFLEASKFIPLYSLAVHYGKVGLEELGKFFQNMKKPVAIAVSDKAWSKEQEYSKEKDKINRFEEDKTRKLLYLPPLSFHLEPQWNEEEMGMPEKISDISEEATVLEWSDDMEALMDVEIPSAMKDEKVSVSENPLEEEVLEVEPLQMEPLMLDSLEETPREEKLASFVSKEKGPGLDKDSELEKVQEVNDFTVQDDGKQKIQVEMALEDPEGKTLPGSAGIEVVEKKEDLKHPHESPKGKPQKVKRKEKKGKKEGSPIAKDIEPAGQPNRFETMFLQIYAETMSQFLRNPAFSQFLEDKAVFQNLKDALPSFQESLEESCSFQESQKKRKKKGKEKNYYVYNDKEYEVYTKERLLEAIEKGKTIRRAYIPTLVFPEVCASKVEILNSVIDWADIRNSYFEGNVSFKGSHFLNKVTVKNSKFCGNFHCQRAKFLGGGDFSETEFLKEVNFNGAHFERYVTWRKSKFQGRAIFAKVNFQKGASFLGSTFHGETSFSEAFSGYRFTLSKCHFQKALRLSNATFEDLCDFSESRYSGETNIIRVHFKHPVKFYNSLFEDNVSIRGSYFEKDAFFQDVEFAGKTDFSGVQGEGNFFFQGMKPHLTASFRFSHVNIKRMFLERSQLEGFIHSHRQGNYEEAQKEYGLLKNNFREINSYGDEDWAYYMEKRMARFALPTGLEYPISSIRRFFEWIALDAGCGYGTKPLNIFFASMLMIALFASLYLLFPGAFEGPPGMDGSSSFGFVDAFVTSFKTFAGSEVGEWHPKATYPAMTLLVMFESFLGIFIMTVLVVTFSRKVIR